MSDNDKADSIRAALTGTWSGTGSGHYPTIADFGYRETVTFTDSGRGFLLYSQRTKRLASDDGMHLEEGFIRVTPAGIVELVLAQPTGFVEVHAGAWEDGTIDFEPVAVVGTPSAKDVSELRRRFVVDGDTLTYDIWMAHADTPLTHHLHATLVRASA